MNTAILETIVRLFSDYLGIPPAQVTPDSTAASLGGDSLDQLELVMAVEDEFCIEIPDEEAEKLNTVQQLVDYVSGVKQAARV